MYYMQAHTVFVSTGWGTFEDNVWGHAWQLINSTWFTMGQHMSIQPADHHYRGHLLLVCHCVKTLTSALPVINISESLIFQNVQILLSISLLLCPSRGLEYCDSMSVCVCLSVRDHIFGTTHPIFPSFLLHSDMLCTSGFMDVIFAHKPRLLNVTTQLKRSAHAALGLAINCVH